MAEPLQFASRPTDFWTYPYVPYDPPDEKFRTIGFQSGAEDWTDGPAQCHNVTLVVPWLAFAAPTAILPARGSRVTTQCADDTACR